MRAAIGIDISFRVPLDSDKMGIYVVYFGDKYYIGSSRNIGKRRSSHVSTLNKLIKEFKVGTASNYNILKHLFINLDIKNAVMELLCEVSSEENLVQAEEVYLNSSVDDANCLNFSQIAIRPRKEKKIYPLIESIKGTLADSIKECVFRLYLNEKYVIVKGKTLVGSLKSISKSLEDFSNKDKSDWPEEHLYIHFIDYILNNTNETNEYSVKILMVANSPYQLLKLEQNELWDNINDDNCLNNTTDAYIPSYNEEKGTYGWINKGQFLSFMKWKNKNMLLPLKTANCDLSIHTCTPSLVEVFRYQKDASLPLSQFCHQQTQKTAFCQPTSFSLSLLLRA